MKATTQSKNRRYQLHQVIKGFLSYSSTRKTIFTHEKELEQLLPKQLNALNELRDKFNYSVQLEIR